MRTLSARSTRCAQAIVVGMVVALAVGVMGSSAQAEDPSPTPSGDSSASPGSTDPETSDPTAAPDLTETPDSGPGKLLLSTLAGTTATPDTVVLRRGHRVYLNVAANDKCSGSCTYRLVSKPSGWNVTLTTAGMMRITAPATARPYRHPIDYRIVDGPQQVQTRVTVRVTLDSYGAPPSMTFTHPYRKGYRYKIRKRILRTINSVPSGARIQVASWSFSSKSYRRALNKARKRGVTVQIVLAARNKRSNSDFGILVRMFGTRVTTNGSWVRKCSYSCRGRAGTMHSKIFLFSEAYRTPYVTMTGSANLTDFAVTNQWNQMNIVSGPKYKPIYDEAVRIFTQMSLDRPVAKPYVSTKFPALSMTSYYYPRGAVTTSNDFMLKALAPVRCTGAVNAGKGGRTIIKIAMYAWYQDRGKWLAKRVRQLWEQGCQVQIIYGISSNPVKKILYNPSGRGRIPMRQILLTNTAGTPIYYIHDKWVAITGNYAGVRNNSVSLHGAFNFSNLGFKSDEQFQALYGRAMYDKFARDFTLLWKDRQARAPSPISTIPVIEGRYSQDDLRLGSGVYRYMEAD